MRGGTPCQDASRVETHGADESILICAISDGAGSALHAAEGARIVVDAWMEHMSGLAHSAASADALDAMIGAEMLPPMFSRIRQRINGAAEAAGVEPYEFSATLLGAVLTPKGGAVAQVGDGCWVARFGGVLGCVTWPSAGEFAGQTDFATSENAWASTQWVRFDQPLEALAGFSDGLERIVLRHAERIPVEGFFLPLFRAIQSEGLAVQTQIEGILRSERICARTDDDKSLALIVSAHGNL